MLMLQYLQHYICPFFTLKVDIVYRSIFILINRVNKAGKLIYKQLWLIKGTIVFVISILVFLRCVLG